MEGNYVGLSDYEGLTGFGLLPTGQQDEVLKALTAGYQSPRHDGGNALRPESLEATLRILTFSQGHVKLWKDIPKLPAYSTSEEYTVQTSYGGENGPFTREGELPSVQDAAYERRVELIKYLGTQREISHPATLVRNAFGNIVARETQNGAVWLMERLERNLFRGQASVIPESFDGIDEQIMRDPFAQANNVLDLRGGVITEDVIEEATNVVVENYGLASALYLAPRAHSDMSKQFYTRQRGTFGQRDGTIGFTAKMMETNAGDIALRGNMFLRSGKNNGIKSAPASATGPGAPAAPTAGNFGTAGANAGSLFTAADAGTYQYKVTALNRFGESAPAQETSGVAVVAGDGVTLVITDGAGTEPATGYRIYRSRAGGAAGTEQMMIDIPRASPAAATTTFVDVNQYLPGTSRAYLLQMNLQSMSFRQLAPMMKIPLATLAASIRWMQLIYGTPIVYAPRKNIILLNVGDGN